MKTLEKAVYKKSDIFLSTSSSIKKSDGLNEDILTKHLLKLNEIENQFRELTNKFEEVNFKLDKLSSSGYKNSIRQPIKIFRLENLDSESKKKKLKKNFLDQANHKILALTQDIKLLIYLKNKKLILLKVLKQ